jgi:hypothetical protein
VRTLTSAQVSVALVDMKLYKPQVLSEVSLWSSPSWARPELDTLLAEYSGDGGM